MVRETPRDELLRMAAALRARAASVGSMSALWEIVFDLEAHAAERPALALVDRETAARLARDDLAEE